MKKQIVLPCTICVISIFLLFACGGGKYADAKKTMKKQADVTIAYVNALESAENAGDVADAINTYTDEMEKLIPDIQKMMKDLPEVRNPQSIPKELEEDYAKASEASAKIETAQKKLFQYITDPQVQKALQHMSEVMQKMNQ